MIKRYEKHICSLLLFAIAMTSVVGCSAPKSPSESLANSDIVVPALIGGVVGGIAGYLIADWLDLDRGAGVAIGVVVGAGTGIVVGKVASDRRKEYESDKEFLDAEIELAEQAIDKKESEIADAQKSLDTTRTVVNDIKAQNELKKDVAEQAKEELAKLNLTIEKNNQVIAQYEDAINYLEEIAEQTDVEKAATAEERKALEERIKTTGERRAKLVTQYEALVGIQKENEKLAKELVPLSRGS